MQRRSFLAGVGAAAIPTRFAIAQSAQATRAATLRMVPQASLNSLDPIWTTAAVTANHALNVYDTLYATDAKLTPKPQMAEGATVSDDGRTWLIRLRDGLRFHDNEPVRAQDCAASIARWAKRDTFGITLAGYVDTFGVADDRTIKITLKRPFPLLLDALAKPFTALPFMMPERMAMTDPFKQITEHVGSGPYRFLPAEYVPGSSIAYARFDGYLPRSEPPEWGSGGKVAHFERVEWRFIPDAATASAALQNGEVDWWEQVQPDLIPLLRKSGTVKFGVADPTMMIGCLRFNHLQPPFNDVRLRRALLRAIDQEDYMRAVTGGDDSLWRRCRSVFPCGTPFGVEQDGPFLKGDIEGARADVKAAGYNGAKLVIINPTDFPSIAPFGEVTYDICKKIGLNAEIAETDWGTVVQRRASREPVEKGGWSIFHTWWTGASTANPAVSAPLRGQGAAGWFGWYGDETIEKLTQEWLDAPDAANRARLALALQQEAFATVPSISLGQFFIRSAYRDNLQGLLEGPSPYAWNVRRA